MKKAENSEKRPEIWRQVFRRMKNQDGASLMAALLFFVFCGVGASIILASASASAGKIRHLPREDQKRYAVDSAAAFLRDELQKTENIVKIKEVIVHDSRDDEEDDEDDFTATMSAAGKTRIMRRRGKNSMERIQVCQAQRVRIARFSIH